MVKSRCETCGEWFEDEKLDEHLNTHLDEVAKPEQEPVPLTCPDCKVGMDEYYGVPFRVGGTGPVGRILIGAWAELGEEPIPIDMYICPQCGRIQQFANKKTRDRLKRATSRRVFRSTE